MTLSLSGALLSVVNTGGYVRVIVALATCAVLASGELRGQAVSQTDTTRHTVRPVAVEPGVELEILDWGGTGPTIVFLPGLNHTAHAFDQFAPRFTDAYHVVGITRRGFGQSSRPATGYDSERRADDIAAVIDTLRLPRVVLAGHSIAGDELSKFGSRYADRVMALIYVDAYDYGPNDVAFLSQLPPLARPMVRSDSASFTTALTYVRGTYGIDVPSEDLQSLMRFNPDGRLREGLDVPATALVFNGTEQNAYSLIVAPALAIYAIPERLVAPGYRGDTWTLDIERRALGDLLAWGATQRGRFQTQVRRGRVVEIQGGHHWIFISHANQVERHMRDFLAGLPR